MKIKIPVVGLILGLGCTIAALGLGGCSWLDPAGSRSGPTTMRPTYSGDESSPPVYTSPTVAPATNSVVNTNSTSAGH
jgi:hypothetical protein